jgi:hypothetical protein
MCDLYIWEICDCDCHEGSGKVHFFPCCYVCEYCGKRIMTMYYGIHVQRHEEDHTSNKEKNDG